MRTGKEFQKLLKAIETAAYDKLLIMIADEIFTVANPDELHQIHTLWAAERGERNANYRRKNKK